jgi:hypothetical protein
MNMNGPEDDRRTELWAYLDGELTPAETHRIEEMLEQSEEARRQLQSLRETWELLPPCEDIVPEPGYRDRFWRSVDAESTGTSTPISSGRAKRILVLALAAAVLLSVGIFLVRKAGDGAVDESSTGGDSVAVQDGSPDADPGVEVDTAELDEDLDILADLAVLEHLDFLMAQGADLEERYDLGLEGIFQDGEELDG